MRCSRISTQALSVGDLYISSSSTERKQQQQQQQQQLCTAIERS
jgi:hypothetical protein